MRALVGLIASGLIVAACVTSSPMATPGPAVSCGDFPAGDCQAAVAVILTLNRDVQVVGTHRTVTRIELGQRIYCPNGPAFDVTSCPAAGMPPTSGGVWIGHAAVTLDGTPFRAFVDLSKNGQTVSGMFTGVATQPPATLPPS